MPNHTKPVSVTPMQSRLIQERNLIHARLQFLKQERDDKITSVANEYEREIHALTKQLREADAMIRSTI